ncbi:MAG: succinate dehydrogenase cytochrome b subunit [Saprospiraceae bacterium]|nr:succinate dehydrogenase cytochrome b subunit [Saprospiraceae bacterium]
MNWFTNFLSSSIGQKIIMSLTGLFLITFLIVHLTGNLQLLIHDEGKQFNLYAKFMTTNPLIKLTSYLLYASILLHAVQGVVLWQKNKNARGNQGYAKKTNRVVGTNSFAASNMAWLGIVIFVFIGLHLYQFWLQMKLGNLPMANYDGVEVKNLYAIVTQTYSNPVYVIVYVFSMAVIGFHLLHGFQSAFQTLGLTHKKYTPLIKGVGTIYAIAVPLLFAIIPVLIYLKIFPLSSFLH